MCGSNLRGESIGEHPRMPIVWKSNFPYHFPVSPWTQCPGIVFKPCKNMSWDKVMLLFEQGITLTRPWVLCLNVALCSNVGFQFEPTWLSVKKVAPNLSEQDEARAGQLSNTTSFFSSTTSHPSIFTVLFKIWHRGRGRTVKMHVWIWHEQRFGMEIPPKPTAVEYCTRYCINLLRGNQSQIHPSHLLTIFLAMFVHRSSTIMCIDL